MQTRWFAALGITVIDQVLKTLVLAFASPGGVITQTLNTGVTFGFFTGANTLMIIISFIALGAIAYYLRRAEQETLGLILLSGGVLGNLIDRIVHGGVVDYLSIGTFPVFNFADACIVTGIVLVILSDLPLTKKFFAR